MKRPFVLLLLYNYSLQLFNRNYFSETPVFIVYTFTNSSLFDNSVLYTIIWNGKFVMMFKCRIYLYIVQQQ